MTLKFESITYAGHSAIFINSKDYVIAVDPWLNNPLCPDSLKNTSKIDLIFLTHGHFDHASDVPALAKKTGAKVVAVFELCQILAKQGVPESQLIYMNVGGCSQHQDVKFSYVHAIHSSTFDTEQGPVYAGVACGVVIKDGTNAIYHAGDTALFSDMKLIGDLYKPDIALLPIGDCFTMGPGDAARAAQLIGAKRLIPIHHSTFPALTGTPEKFVQNCQNIFGDSVNVAVLQPGATLAI